MIDCGEDWLGNVRDTQVLDNVSVPELTSHLNGQAFESTSRHGKYLFAHLNDEVLVLHFGMTGTPHYYKDPEKEPEYTQLLCTFRNSYHLAYSSEILFQARIHPETSIDRLDEKTLQTVFEAMKSVLKTAIDCDAEPSQFPDGFIIRHRHEDGECPFCGGSVERIKISGRSAYYCPSCQEKLD